MTICDTMQDDTLVHAVSTHLRRLNSIDISKRGDWRTIFYGIGLGGLLIGEELGGSECSILDALSIASEISALSNDLDLSRHFNVSALVCSYILKETCTGETRARILQEMCTGSFCGFDLTLAEFAMRNDGNVTVTSFPCGSESVLEGSTIVRLQDADFYLIAVRDKVGSQCAVYLVPATASGISIEKIPGEFGLAKFTVESYRSAQEHRLGPWDEVGPLVAQAFDLGTVGTTMCVSTMLRRVFDCTLDFLNLRTQFGRRLIDFQVLQHGLADIYVETRIAHGSALLALEGLTLPSAQRQQTVSLASVAATRAARRVLERGVQLHGAMGMVGDYPVGAVGRLLMALTEDFGSLDQHYSRLTELATT